MKILDICAGFVGFKFQINSMVSEQAISYLHSHKLEATYQTSYYPLWMAHENSFAWMLDYHNQPWPISRLKCAYNDMHVFLTLRLQAHQTFSLVYFHHMRCPPFLRSCHMEDHCSNSCFQFTTTTTPYIYCSVAISVPITHIHNNEKY